MPAIPLHPPSQPTVERSCPSPLPSLLQTPLGLALVEIQGSLNIPERSDNEPVAQHVGRLEFPLLEADNAGTGEQEGPWMKQVYLYVGERQRLAGEVKRLDKAIGVMRKRAMLEERQTHEALEIVDIIKWKLYFGSRPEFV